MGLGGAYKRGPSGAAALGGLLIEIVERGKGCADGGRRAVLMFVHRCERLEALVLGPSERTGLG